LVTLLAEAFETGEQDVLRDVQIVLLWQEPLDDLIVWLCHQHTWRPDIAVNYLITIRKAMYSRKFRAERALDKHDE